MTKSLRRQKIALERTLADSVNRGIYEKDRINPSHYILKKPISEKSNPFVEEMKRLVALHDKGIEFKTVNIDYDDASFGRYNP